MPHSKCPVCGCEKFYVKNPDDEFDIYEFECRDGEICFDEEPEGDACPEISEGTETFCSKCVWHDKFHKLK